MSPLPSDLARKFPRTVLRQENQPQDHPLRPSASFAYCPLIAHSMWDVSILARVNSHLRDRECSVPLAIPSKYSSNRSYEFQLRKQQRASHQQYSSQEFFRELNGLDCVFIWLGGPPMYSDTCLVLTSNLKVTRRCTFGIHFGMGVRGLSRSPCLRAL